MISNDTINRVRELPIVEVLSRYISLKRQGANYVGCCPFHGEKTPSLSVTPSKNLWYCFGCGKNGDAITFVQEFRNLDFQGAVEEIANGNGIEIVRTERSAEDNAIAQRREALLNSMQQVHEFFVSQIKAPDAEPARQYAYARWPQEFCDEVGIGFAPLNSAPLLEFCKRSSIDMELLLHLGVFAMGKDKQPYASLRNRITIPIFNRANKVIGFTARTIGNDKIKYLNLTNSDIFSKSEAVFGINVASRVARDAGYFILVEGAPDVLRLQSLGLSNAIATLGTAWSEKHFEAIKRISSNLCFIPDSDPAKDNKIFGAGFMAVLKNGAEAMRHGFNVTVRELPFADDGGKNDADSYLKCADDFYSLPEKHFVVWLAEKRFPHAKTLVKVRDTANEIVSLLSKVDDRVIINDCITQLAKIHGDYKMWQNLLTPGSSTEAVPEVADKVQANMQELLKKFNLYISQNMYFYSGGEEPVRLSNFILEPMYHIKDENNGTRIFRIVNEYNEKEVVEFREAELVSLAPFQQKVGSLGNYIWRGKVDKLTLVKELLYSLTDSADLVKQMGWDPKNEHYAWGNGILKDGRFVKVDDLGIVAVDGRKFYIPATSVMYRHNTAIFQFERLFQHENRSSITLHDFAQKVIDVFGNNGKVGLCFLFASLFRDIIYPIKNCFPILNLFGLKGTGKTSLATTLQSFFIHSVDPPSIGIASIPSMNDRVSQVTNAMVVFDEYKNDMDERKIAYLKALWGGAGQTKKNVNGDGKASQTVVTSAVCICGQDLPTRDIALYSRVIHLTFTRPSFNSEERRRFDDLKDISNLGNTHLAIEVLNHRGIMEKNYRANHSLVKKELATALGDEEIEDRVFDNWIVPLATFRCLENVLRLPFTYTDLFDITLAGIRYQNEGCKKNTEMAEFWEFLDSLHSQGKILDKAHFCIKYVTEFQAIGKNEPTSFATATPILMLNPSAISALYSGRVVGGVAGRSANNWGTVLTYLKVQPSFLGLKQQRFNILMANGTPDYKIEVIGGVSHRQLKVNRPKALCFDYKLLKDKYSLNLETSSVDEREIDSETEPNGIETQLGRRPMQRELPY